MAITRTTSPGEIFWTPTDGWSAEDSLSSMTPLRGRLAKPAESLTKPSILAGIV